MATSLATFQTRLEAAETAYDTMMSEGRGIVEYREADGRFVRKDPAELRAYIEYLQQQVAALSGGSTMTLASFGGLSESRCRSGW